MARQVVWLLPLLCALGCAPRAARLRYELTPERLTPPPGRLPVEVRGVAGPNWKADRCTARAGVLALQWRGPRAVLEVPAGGREVNDPRVLEQFRTQVAHLEDTGCLGPAGAARVLDTLACALDLPPSMIYFARYGVYYDTAAVDIEPQFRLKVVGPLLAPGVKELKVEAKIPDKPGPIQATVSPGLEGYETSYYAVRRAGADGVTLRLESVEQNRVGAITRVSKPAGFTLNPPANAWHFRLLFLRRVSKSDRDITLLGAPDRRTLTEASQRIETAADSLEACRAERAAWCLAVPTLSAVTPELLVKVNGKPVSVGVGGNVAEAVGKAGAPRQVAASLRVLRPWRGKMIPIITETRPELMLRLVLIGGEEIRY
jgi:hypothetical protein